LGLSLEQLRLTLHGSGRWSCEECFFSLAHSGQAVAVAISDAPIGVDLERLDRRVNPSLSRKILSPRQQEAFSLLDSSRQSRYLLETWCIRESLFKWREAASKDQPEPPSLTGTVTVAGQDYCYGVVSDHSECLQIFTDISL
jgi:phosphopantetheinyl transferase